jgi:hypothetical protein
MKVIKLLMREIENQIEDKVVPVISSILGSSMKRNDSRTDSNSRLESYENGEDSSPQYSDSTNEKIPFIQNENGFI